ncbi:putative membrane protein [Peribacillus deserti]|uniref:Membrane protein n=1 Tax=Peribacillus deserti TaxID=673318 RepID=A0ABS2QJC9_9BACI|nr:hypothetical protein [Peribacillus deserti]MBM7693055.1 putative membrane protein [Peribacillus deserti]
MYWLIIFIVLNFALTWKVYAYYKPKRHLLDSRFIFTMLFTLPALASIVNGMVVFFLGVNIFASILISAVLGLVLGGLIGSLFNFFTFSIGAVTSSYFGIMGPMISTPIVSSELCGFAASGGALANSLSLTFLGFCLTAFLTSLFIYIYKV